LLVELLLKIFGKRTNFCVNYTAPFRTDPVRSPSPFRKPVIQQPGKKLK